MLVRGGIADRSPYVIQLTVNRLSTNVYCSWPFVQVSRGPWGNGYTFPEVPNNPYLRYLQSNGSMDTPFSC